MFEQEQQDAVRVVEEFLKQAQLKKGDLVVSGAQPVRSHLTESVLIPMQILEKLYFLQCRGLFAILVLYQAKEILKC